MGHAKKQGGDLNFDFLIISKHTMTRFYTSILIALLLISCKTNVQVPLVEKESATTTAKEIKTGADQVLSYLPLLQNKRIAIVANPSTLIKKHKGYTHVVDSLLALELSLKKVFSPEHGFRGKADAGEKVVNGMDVHTGLPIISLYGAHKKPTKNDLKGIDIILFDLQDVGVRFYTYISTLHYVMEAAAEQHIPVLVLDRPNPNAHYIDGPVLEDPYHSFIGMHPVPIVYGMTIGEYAKMINGEHWLQNGLQCDLQVIALKNYTHQSPYNLPVKPSPNLPNAQAVNLYPSLCFFEGTGLSCGRGTAMQFQTFGAPNLDEKLYPFRFTPLPNTGAKHPKHQGEVCHGLDLRQHKYLSEININWLLDAYKNSNEKKHFFNPFFIKLAGTASLQNQIELGYAAEDIKKTWQPGLEKFKKIRLKYLLYD